MTPEQEEIARLTGWHLGTDRPAMTPAPEETQRAGYWYDADGNEMASAYTDAFANRYAYTLEQAKAHANGYDPTAAYLEQPWHTVETLRELAREQAALITALYAGRGTIDYIKQIEATPQAFRIFGAIEHYLVKGYDADHIIAWLDAGAKTTEL